MMIMDHQKLAPISRNSKLGPNSLLSCEQAAGMLGLSLATVRRWVGAGDLPIVRLGRQVRIRIEDVEALMTATEKESDL